MNDSVPNYDDHTYKNYSDSPLYHDYQANNSLGTQNNSGGFYGNMNDSVPNYYDYTDEYHVDSPMYPDYQENNSLGTQNNSGGLYGNQDNWIGNAEYTEFVYQAFDFERPIYLYLWQILVAITALVNILVIWVLLKKNMRTVTNMILVAIAISDSMTGLVTLPTYIMVYQSQESGIQGGADDVYDDYMYDEANYTAMLSNTTTNYDEVQHYDAYFLSKSLCNAFMISKFFLSKSFHTASIWLTVYLGVQRYISVAYPFKKDVLLTTRNTLIICIAIAVSAPFLHLYHLIDEKAVQGYCAWKLKEGCGGGCAHVWITLLFRHLFPCAILTITTVLFVRHFRKNSFNSTNSSRKHSSSSNAKGDDKTGRATMIVIAVVIGLLVPEMPYGIFLFYTSMVRHTNMAHLNDLKRNRAIHAGYEIVLVLTFHLNFYIFTFLNVRFRRKLLKTFFFLTSRVGRFSLIAGTSSTAAPRTAGVSGTKSESMSNTLDSKGMKMKPLNHSSDDQTDGKLP